VLSTGGHNYPSQEVAVLPFPSDFSQLFPTPQGFIESDWPPTQITYLGEYLAHLGCKTIVLEKHYVDRDYISDVALFYSRSLRAYPNFCQRLHFFGDAFESKHWRDRVVQLNGGNDTKTQEFFQRSYLGFSVIRPLPGSPIGRTVLKTVARKTQRGEFREFGAIREYAVHLGGFELTVHGLAFQQQDQGVSACATTALWSAMHAVARKEALGIPTPADITQAASRYVLASGRSLPSDGLNIQQICEAARAAGLEPMLIRSLSLDQDRVQLLSYISSGFAPVLAIQDIEQGLGHAVCAVGVKLGETQPQSDPGLHFRENASAVSTVYIHDDRLGPYASADLYAYTQTPNRIRTALKIRWPRTDNEDKHALLDAIIVPVPAKLRLNVTRMRALGLAIAEAAGQILPQFNRTVALNTRYAKGTDYLRNSLNFGLSDEGLYSLLCELTLSRYVGLIEISVPDGPLFDVLLDTTETRANPAALACVRRSFFPKAGIELGAIARKLGAKFVF
jgi:hypothetical protein